MHSFNHQGLFISQGEIVAAICLGDNSHAAAIREERGEANLGV